MSYPRQQSITPYDDNPIRNLEFVKPHPTQRYQSISIAKGKFCLLCGMQYSVSDTLCPLGHPNGRVFEANELVTHTTASATAPLRWKVEMCWNETEDPISHDHQSHPLEMVKVPVVNLAYEEWHNEHRCKTCGMAYSWTDGRRATPAEIEAAKQGKMELKTTDKAKIARVG